MYLQYLPMDYLLKTEPTVYSFADLEREKATIWDGVTNPTAVKHLREMKPGERLVIYHTGCKRSPDSTGEDQSGEGDREAEDAGGDQSAGGLFGVSAGEARAIERGAADRGTVRVAGRRVSGPALHSPLSRHRLT